MKKIILLFLCALSIQANAQIAFAPPVTYPVGPNPQGVISADVNGDGKPDLICANTGNNTLTILTNNGAGGFVLASSPNVGSYPVSVTAADVNGDGYVDLISANLGTDTITILTNDGHGGFTIASSPQVGQAPLSVAAVDVNGDGKIDLIAANNGSGTLSILTNNGTGGFALASSPTVGSYPAMVIAADLYKNGQVELICDVSGNDSLCVLTNAGSGVFAVQAQLAVGSNPHAFTVGDVTGDGYPDLITANTSNGNGNTLTILTNNQIGGFSLASSPQVGQNPCFVKTADLNGNGNQEIISVNLSGTLSVLTNNGSAGFAVATNISMADSYAVLPVDVNGDGKIDLVATSRGNSALSVFLNTTIIGAPTITVNLQNQPVVVGSNTNLSVVATGKSPLSYQWYFVPTNNPGQAGAYAQTIAGFVYGAVVTNGGYGYGVSPNVSFIGTNGSGAAGYGIVSNGVLTGITVTSAGSGYSNTPAVLIDPPNGILIGQTNSYLTISNASLSSLGSYFVLITNQSGSVTSSVVNLTLLYPPSVNIGPSGFTAGYHTYNSLTVYASGTAPLSYQWALNGTNLVGATNYVYVISALDLTNTGAYTVKVSSPYGQASGGPANVYVAPALTSPFSGSIGVWGQSTTLEVGAVGSGVLSYQWYFNGTAIPGATSNPYVLNSIQLTNAGLYSVVVSSAYGSVTNQAYQVVVNPANIQLGICPMVYVTGTAGYSYAIQSTTNLANINAWVTVTNLTIPYSPYIWADTATDTSLPANPHKFYRVIAGQ